MTGLSEYQRRLVSIGLVCLLCFGVYSCGQKQNPMEKMKDLESHARSNKGVAREM